MLLAGPDGAAVVADTTGDDLESDRLALLDRSASMAEVLDRRGLVLRSDLLRPWAHWITPEFEPRRFDTRFFVAAVPPGQLARDVSGEADSTVWLPVVDAVAAHEAGELAMLPPTIESLRELATHATVDDVLAAPREVRPVMPRLVEVGDRTGPRGRRRDASPAAVVGDAGARRQPRADDARGHQHLRAARRRRRPRRGRRSGTAGRGPPRSGSAGSRRSG